MCYKKPGPRCSAHAAAKLARMKTLRNFSVESEERVAEAQKEYDSTPAGFLELERRIKSEKESRYSDADFLEELETRLAEGKQRRADALNKIKSDDVGDKKHESSKVSLGENVGENDVHFLLEHDKNSSEAFECKEILIEASQQWMNDLTPEEAEAVSWGTSNGTAVLRAHTQGKEHEIWGHDVYSEAHLNEVMGSLNRAMDKAPRLEEPVFIYRGLNGDTFEDISPTVSDVENMFPVGENYKPSFAESATMHPKIAYGFSMPGVVMKVKSKTMASPVNVSAWGTSEMEVLVNHRKEYKVTDVAQESWGESASGRARDLIVVSLEEV